MAKRKRRTKAEMEAAKAKDELPSVDDSTFSDINESDMTKTSVSVDDEGNAVVDMRDDDSRLVDPDEVQYASDSVGDEYPGPETVTEVAEEPEPVVTATVDLPTPVEMVTIEIPLGDFSGYAIPRTEIKVMTAEQKTIHRRIFNGLTITNTRLNNGKQVSSPGADVSRALLDFVANAVSAKK